MGKTSGRTSRKCCTGAPGVSRTLLLTSERQPDSELASTQTAVSRRATLECWDVLLNMVLYRHHARLSCAR